MRAVNKTTPIRRGLLAEGAKVTYIFHLMHTTHVLTLATFDHFLKSSTICVQTWLLVQFRKEIKVRMYTLASTSQCVHCCCMQTPLCMWVVWMTRLPSPHCGSSSFKLALLVSEPITLCCCGYNISTQHSECTHAQGQNRYGTPRLRICRVYERRGCRLCYKDYEHD